MKDQERIAAIRARLEAATPGPWRAVGIPYNGLDDPAIVGPGDVYVAQTVYDMQSTTLEHDVDADTTFIAHARDDIAWLLDLLDECL